MKVVCVNDNEQYGETDNSPDVKKGNVYTVIEIIFEDADADDEYSYDAGRYYILAETGCDWMYHESLFIEINQDQKDEKEFERNYNKEQA